MTTIAASLPGSSFWVPSVLENIIDKRISGITLNIFEKIADWVLSWVCCPYLSLYKEKLSRVHNFSDIKVQLFDATKDKSVKIEFEWDRDFITINKKRVCFNPAPDFTSKAFTHYILVKDDPKRGQGWFEIIQQELPRPNIPKPMEIHWSFNISLA